MDVTQRVRQALYEMTAREARVPSCGQLAAARGLDQDEVRSAYRALDAAHVIVLKPGSVDVWSAPPFSAVETPFQVRPSLPADLRRWHAPCAWDAFGIPAALKQDVEIAARCAETGEPLPASVRAGTVRGAGLIHLVVPAKRFWDDIFYT